MIMAARAMAVNFPGDSRVLRELVHCRSQDFLEAEALAILEAQQETDASVVFNLGLYWSESVITDQETPLFAAQRSSQVWAQGLGMWREPEGIARAEALMLEGESHFAGTERAEKEAQRSLRLFKHGLFLAQNQQDAAAEQRYRLAGALAAQCRRKRLSAHILARFGYFLSLRGRKQEALVVANDALSKEEGNPVARFLQMTLRREFGELRTDAEMETYVEQLTSLAGKLPSKLMEQQRHTALQEALAWRTAVSAGLKGCLGVGDVARVLICAIGHVVFEK